MDGGKALFDEDFGQKVDLTVRIREILQAYADGISIVKELLQNADDAKASTVRFCWDQRQHGTQSIVDPKMAPFQGPALLIYNSGLFTEADFESIQNIGNSMKKTALNKTGRFGIGFNSVYHVTDLPSFVSGRHIVYFDPHAQFLPNINPSNPGKRIDFMANSQVLNFADQFAGFRGAFGCTLTEPFNGTIFRLPLRTAQLASTSRLSASIPDMSLLQQHFCHDSSQMLLFLKSVEYVDWSVWHADCTTATLIHSVSLSICKRTPPGFLGSQKQSQTSRNFLSLLESPQKDDVESTDFFEFNTVSESGDKQNELWLVSNRLDAHKAKALADKAASSNPVSPVKLLPWAGVAARLNFPQPLAGRAYCFLPLPVNTLFPVHINGYFELSSNRRDIWWGQDVAGELKSSWNRVLLEEVVAPSYCSMLQAARPQNGDTELLQSYYNLWPLQASSEPWLVTLVEIYRRLYTLPCLWTSAKQGAWVTPQQALFLDESDQSNADRLQSLLLRLGLPVVRVSAKHYEQLNQACKSQTQSLSFKVESEPCTRVSGSWLRVFLKQQNKQFAEQARALTSNLSREDGLFLLSLVMSDLSDYSDMLGIPLLPLASGTFTTFASEPIVYVANSVDFDWLIAKNDNNQLVSRHLLASNELSSELLQKLQSSESQKALNLRVLDESAVAVLVPLLFGCDTKSPSPNFIPYDPKWRATLQSLLNYVSNARNLTLFTKFPMIPVTTICAADPIALYSLSTSNFLIENHDLSDDVAATLTLFGFRLIDKSFAFQHSKIYDFVRRVSLLELCSDLHSLLMSKLQPGDDKQTFFDSLNWTTAQRRAVRSFFASLFTIMTAQSKKLDVKSISTLRLLPFWESYSNSQNSDANESLFCSLLDLHRLPPLEIDHQLLTADFINCHDAEVQMAQAVGLKRMTAEQFYTDVFLPRLSVIHKEKPVLFERTMMKVLKLWSQSWLKDATDVAEKWSQTACIPNKSGDLCRVNSLFDPAVPELSTLLDADTQFPSSSFSEPASLPNLRLLGLRSHMGADGVLDLATLISSWTDQPEKAHMFGQRLLTHVDRNASKYLSTFATSSATGGSRLMNFFFSNASAAELEQEWWSKLKQLSWLPAKTTPTEPALPWTESLSSTAVSTLIRSHTDEWLVSSSLRLLDGTVRSPELRAALGLDQPIPSWALAQQVVALATQFDRLKKLTSVVVADDDTAAAETKSQQIKSFNRLKQMLASTIPTLYRLLDAAARSSDAESQSITIELQNKQWLWVGADVGFIGPERLAFKVPVQAQPYLYAVLPDFCAFDKLFGQCGGVRATFNVNDYMHVLLTMATESTEPGPLSASQLELSLAIVNYLSDRASQLNDIVLLPSDNCTLLLAPVLYFNDAPWLSTHGDLLEPGSRFVHPKVSNDVAQRLGARSFRQRMLSKGGQAKSMALVASNSLAGAQAFGQRESITRRLRTILELYPEGPGVLFEMIQNADDAKASEVCIVLDTTSYATSSLLSPAMSDWQGPALCVYNNATFSPRDYQNVARIGQGSKLDRLASTGRFGLGFNAVYHFSDVPSFVSGDSIVFLDPHGIYVPAADGSGAPSESGSSNGGGLKLALGTSVPLDVQFPDQFAPYRMFGFDCRQNFAGTLFRFPLRTTKTAQRSEIKREALGISDLKNLLSAFREIAGETLLFLRHVNKITVKIIDTMPGGGASVPTSVPLPATITPRVDRRCVRNLFQVELPIPAHRQRSLWARLPDLDIESKESFYVKLRASPENKLPRVAYSMDISFSEYASDPQIISALKDSQFSIQQPTSLSEDGAVELQTVVQSDWNSVVELTVPKICDNLVDTFFIVEMLGGGRAKLMATDDSCKHLKLLPYAAVASRLPRSWNMSETKSNVTNVSSVGNLTGRAFCFLPLPLLTGLPVHLNAYFELSANRRDLWWGEDMSGEGQIRTQWNQALLDDAIAPAYAFWLVQSSTLINQLNDFRVVQSQLAKQDSAVVDSSAPKVHSLEQLLATYFSYFPSGANGNSSSAPFARLISRLFAILCDQPVVYAPMMDESNEEKGMWFVPNQALRLPVVADRIPGLNTEAALVQIGDLLKSAKCPVATQFPMFVQQQLLEYGGVTRAVQTVTPDFLRRWLRQDTGDAAAKSPNELFQNALIWNQKARIASIANLLSKSESACFLLRICLSDMGTPQFDYTQLIGVPLLMLANGKVGKFAANSVDSSYFVTNSLEFDLLSQQPKIVNSLVATSGMDADVMKHLVNPALHAATNVQIMTETIMSTLMSRMFPPSWKDKAVVAWRPDPPFASAAVVDALSVQPTMRTIELIGQYLSSDSVTNLSLFESWPLLPLHHAQIDFSNPMAPGSVNGSSPFSLCLLKRNARPVISIDPSKPLPDDVMALLTQCGARPVALSYRLRHNQMGVVSYAATLPGILQVLIDIASANLPEQATDAQLLKSISNMFVVISPTLRRALRAFITRCVTEAIGGVDGDISKHPFNHLKSLVAKLPIFEACTDYVPLDLANVSSSFNSTVSVKEDRSKDSIEDESVFVDLLSTARYLAPLEISERRLLNSAFLKPPSDPNESVLILQKWLGVGRLQPVEFYTQHLFPRLKYLPSEIRDSVMLKVLLDVPMLARSNPLLMTQIMPNLAFLPTASASDSTLFMPSQLYDPTVPELSALLDADTCFPAAQYVAQPKLLGMLRTLGLRTALDARGVVTSIHSIARTAKANSGVSASSNSLQVDFAVDEPAAHVIASEQKPKSRLLAAMPAPVSTKATSVQAELEATSKAVFSLCLQPSSVNLPMDLALIRARRLLAYVNSNWANISASLNITATSNAPESVQSDANQSLNRSMFLSLLRSQPWLPVLTASPEPTLPWPSAVSLATALAPGLLPATVLNMHTDVFPPLASFACPLASPTHTQPASQSSLVSSVLRLLDDRTVICTELAQAFGWNDALPPAALCKQLLGFQSMLVKHTVSKSNTDSKSASSSNSVTPAAAVAASPAVTVPRIDANLSAFVAKSVDGIYSLLNSALAASNSDMIGKLIRTLLHQQAWFFDTETFYPTSRLAFGFASSTLGGPQSHIDTDLKLDPYLHVIESKIASAFSTLFNTMQVPAVFKYSDLNAALAMMGKESHIEPFNDAKIALSIQLLQHIAYVAAPAEAIRNITSLNLLVPCEDGRLFVASMLTFNDAPWLSSNQLNKESIQFVHASVDAELSTALGVRSLRELLLVNKSLKKDIVCMSANMVRAQLRATLQSHTFLMDLLEVADLAGARKFELLFDERSYLTQSILNPGLAECQGPSISLYFDAELSFEDVMKLHVGSSAVAQRELDALSRVDQNHASAPHVPLYHNSFAVRTSHTLFGNGIVQSFNVADVMLMVSGSSFFVFDPAGKCFVEAQEDHNSLSSSSDEAGGVGRVYPSSIHSRFPDQFAPFTLLGFDMSRGLIPSGGTIIRLPLRRRVTPNSITSNISDSTFTESVLSGFQLDSHQSLVFLSSLEQISIRSIRDSQPQPKLLWQSLIKLQQTTREARVFMRDRTDWRSASLSSFFMGFAPIRHVHSVSLTGVDHRTNETNEDVYVVASVLGAGATRDLAFKNAAAHVSKQAPDSSSHSYWSAWTPVGQVAAKVFSNGQSAAAEPGRLFVHGLPFQQDTGLPVHINAFFHLSQARRFEVFDTDALSKPTASAASAAPLPSGQLLQFPFFVEMPRDEAGGPNSNPDSQSETPQEAVPGSSGPALPADAVSSVSPLKYAVGTDHRAVVEWNHELLHSCVGDACVDLLIQLRDILVENMRPLLYKFWPLRQNAQLPFVHILPSFAHRVAGHVQPLFLNSDGKFVQLSECAFRAPALMASVERVMSPKFVALFSVPPRIADDLVAANVKKVNVFSAAQCRALIKQKSDLNRYFLTMDADASKHRILLDVLHFCLSDMQSNKFDELLTLPLLLFANGRIGVFGRDEGIVVTTLQQRLFPSQAAFMLDSKCAAELTNFLSNAQFQSSLHIRHFNAAFVAQHLPQILPSKLRSGEITTWPQYNRQVLDSWPAFAIPFHPEVSESNQNSAAASSQQVPAESELNIVPPTPGTLPSPGWLRALWNCGAVDFGDSQHRQILRLYSLVPLLSGELTSLSKLEPVAATPLGRILIMSSENQRDAAMALSSIGISVLDNRFFSAADIEALLSRYGGGYSIYNALISMIPSLAALQRFGNNVPTDAGRACLEFVADGFRSGRFTGVDDPRQRVSIVNALRTLPIFEFLESPAAVAVSTSSVAASSSMTQVLKSLPDGETFYMLAPEIDIPSGFRNFILSTSRFVAYRFPELSRFLGIEQLSESRLFELHLPLAWPQLSETDQTELIQHIQHRWSSIRTPELIDIVREIPFVPVQRANIDLRPRYCCAHQLFDPRNALFAKIFSDDAVFPSDVREPVDWRSTASLDFLALVGMRTRLDATSFVECARKVEQLGRVFFPASAPADIPFAADSISLNSKSDISDAEISRFKSHQRALSLGAELISQLFGQAVSELFTPALCTSISDIAFVPVDCSMLLIQPAGRTFSSAIIQHAQPSAITSLFSHLMPASASSQSVTHFPAPSPHAWLARYRDVCLRRDRSLVWTVAPVLPSVCEPAEMALRFLQLSTPPSISLVMSHLQSICSIPLDQWTHEDAPSVVFVDICKYLTSELNSRRLDSKALNALREIPLVPIGNRLVKSSRLFFRLEQDLAPFMFEVPRAFGTFDALLKALGARETAQASDYLLFLRELSEESLNGQNALNINEINAIVRVLTLIAEARDSVTEAVLVPDSEGRLVLATACAFNNAPHMAVRADPNKLKLVSAKLSDRLCRRLGVPPLSAVVEEVLSSDTVPVDDARFDMMRAAFQSSEFAAALVVIANDRLLRDPDRVAASQLHVPSADELHGWLNAYSLRAVQSLHTRLLLQIRSASVQRLDVTRHDASEVRHFVDHRSRIVYVCAEAGPPPLCVETFLTHALQMIVERQAPSALRWWDHAAVAALLMSGSPSGSFSHFPHLLASLHIVPLDLSALRRGVPGMPVLPVDREFATITPSRRFLDGEVVAIEDHARVMRYAIVVSDSRTNSNEIVGSLGVRVDHRDETVQVSSASVYSFRTNIGTSQRQPISTSTSVLVPFEQAPVTINTSSSSSQVNVSSLPSNVSGSELMLTAVTDLLSRANMPLDLDRSALLKTAMEAQRSQSDMKAELEKLRLECSRSKARLEEIAASLLCTVCQTNDVGLSLPCGHQMCAQCERSMRVKKCPFCRETFETTVKWFKPF